MWFSVFTILSRGKLRRSALLLRRNVNDIRPSSSFVAGDDDVGKSSLNGTKKFPDFSTVSGVGDIQTGSGKMTLATNLASLLEESYEIAEEKKKPRSRFELKRSLENRIKKKAKENCVNGKFRDLVEKVIADST